MPQDADIDGGNRCGELDVRTVGDHEDEGSRVRAHRDSVKGGHARGVWHENCATFTIDYIGKHKLTFAACELLFSAISRGDTGRCPRLSVLVIKQFWWLRTPPAITFISKCGQTPLRS